MKNNLIEFPLVLLRACTQNKNSETTVSVVSARVGDNVALQGPAYLSELNFVNDLSY